MHIARMNVRILFQKNETVVDEIGNHTNKWVDYFSCYASASGQNGDESEVAGQTAVNERMDFTIRYSSETAAITTDHFRIILGDRIYDIKSIDDMGFKKHSLKMHTELRRR